MRLEARKYLYDIQQATELAVQFTKAKEYADYQRDPMLRLAVERTFSIMGEALLQLSRVDAALAARISGFRKIISFSNSLVHAYAQIDDRIVWGIVQTELPALSLEVAALMDEGSRP